MWVQQNGEDVLDGVVTVTEKILPDELLVTGGGEVDEFAFAEGGDQQSGMVQVVGLGVGVVGDDADTIKTVVRDGICFYLGVGRVVSFRGRNKIHGNDTKCGEPAYGRS